MKRYYYTDPLKAAWMAREFEVKLQTEDGYPLQSNGDVFRVASKNATTFVPADDNDVVVCWFTISLVYAYIHPDSLPIFEPRVGDVGFDAGCKTACHVSDYGKFCYDSDPEPWAISPLQFKIIQRDNKAFFMPEVER